MFAGTLVKTVGEEMLCFRLFWYVIGLETVLSVLGLQLSVRKILSTICRDITLKEQNN